MKNNFELLLNEKLSQIELFEDELKVGYISYEIVNSTINLTYIYVDPAYRGQGLTPLLMDYLVDIIRDRNLKANPICPVISKLIQEPKYRDVIE